MWVAYIIIIIIFYFLQKYSTVSETGQSSQDPYFSDIC